MRPARAILVACCALALLPLHAAQGKWADRSPHREGFVTANGVRLQYLEWGNQGPALILIHGLGDNPHYFDDLAPAFADRFHVIAYARRGHGDSEVKGPYTTAVLTEDLRALMDALGIAKAHLAGWSLGGNEITAMAAEHPERVGKLIYLEAAYDWADPRDVIAVQAIPSSLSDTPASAMSSLDAYRAFEKATEFAGLGAMQRVEAYLRDGVVIQPDGSLKPKMPAAVLALFTTTLLHDRRDYTDVRAPGLAIYAQSVFNLNAEDPRRRRDAWIWEQRYFDQFRESSIVRVVRELPGVEVLRVPGAHASFILTSRAKIVACMREFLAKD